MNLDTRDRLLSTGLELFANHGYRGASVRDICNLARANPGAISYHFGGKRQLYRAILRHAGDRLFAAAFDAGGADDQLGPARDRLLTATTRVRMAIVDHPQEVHLIMRDLADGGKAVVEALAPPLQRAEQWLRSELDKTEDGGTTRSVQRTFVELAAPIFLMAGAWPILERALGLDRAAAESLLRDLAEDALSAGAFSRSR